MFSFERRCHESGQIPPARSKASNCALTTYAMIATGSALAIDYRFLRARLGKTRQITEEAVAY